MHQRKRYQRKRDLLGDVRMAGFETLEDALNTLYPRLKSSREVGKILKIDRQTVLKYLRVHNIPVMSRGGANRPSAETYTGKCRKHGVSDRYVRGGDCVQCARARNLEVYYRKKLTPFVQTESPSVRGASG